MIELVPHPRGVLLAVRAQPRARRSGIVGEHAGALKIAVTDAPERGKANQAIIEVLCEQLDLRKSQVTLVSGDTSREKRVLIASLSRSELQARLERLITEDRP